VNGPRIGSLFSGYGGLEQGVQAVLGGSAAWVSDIDPGACKILAHRYPDVPNLGDITAVDWSAVEPVDVLTGGSPCQDLSHAGKRGGMTEGTRSNLWVAMRDAIERLRPPLVVWENVRGAYSACADSEMGSCPGCVGDGPHRPLLRAVGRVLGDLSELGFDAEWVGIRASDVGAPHGRYRIFIAAWDASLRGRHDPRAAGRRGERSGAARGSDSATVPHPQGHRWGQGWAESARIVGGPNPAIGGSSAIADPNRPSVETCRGRSGAWDFGRRESLVDSGTDWGIYGAAVHRWERLTRPAPAPTEIGAKGQQQLSPAFVEWMQGLPAGWVTDPAIWTGMTYSAARNAQLHALGNGVCPPQAAAALRLLLPDVTEAAA